MRVGDAAGVADAPRGDRPRGVLAVLLSRRGRPVPAEVLLDLVWGEDAPSVSVVHTVVARLRRQHGAGLVHTTDAGYLVPPDVQVDADRFVELATSPRTEDRVERLREAVGLWTGSAAYAGVPGDLVLVERVRLEELHRHVRRELAAALLEGRSSSGADEALRLGLELLAEQPLDEEAAVLAMRAADRLRRPAEALETFAALRHRLREELGVDPGPAAVAEHRRLLDRAADAPTARTRPVHPGFRLPTPTSPTIGREAELDAVLSAVAQGIRLVTITGPGGVGKSRLLADAGARLTEAGVDLAFVALSGHAGSRADDLAAGLAMATGLPLRDVGGSAVAGLVHALRSAEVTVLADEAEWVLEPAAELARAILAGCPGVRLVVTSRMPLGVLGERLVDVAPLAVPGSLSTPDDVRTSPAVRLLAERLTDRGVGSVSAGQLPWSDAELSVLAEVARRLDGLPLALELIAGRAATMPIADLVEVVEQPLDLDSVEVGRDARQRSLRRTISWSVDRLDPEARVALGRLAVFAGSFSPAAARAVLGGSAATVDRVLGELAASHLVAVDRGDDGLGFRMLRTVRDLAREELEASGRLEATRDRHAAWFAGLWRDARLSDELVEHVGRTYDDHLEALQHLLDRGQPDAAADVGLALCRRWLFVETPDPGLHWTGRLLEHDDLRPVQRARLRVTHAAFGHRIAWTDAELAEVAAALEGDADWTVLLGLMTAITAYVQGDVELARKRLDGCQRVASRSARHALPEIIATRGVVEAAAGRPDLAVASAQEALAWVGARASAVDHVAVLPKVALSYLDAGRPRDALDLLTSAAAEARARFGIRPTATMATNAGWAALLVGEPGEALVWFGRALVGPQAFAAAGAVGEAAVGAAVALVELGRPGAADLLGQGRWLLDQDEVVLPPSIAALVAGAVATAGATPPPGEWRVDLAVARVVQLVRVSG
ncbi:BTAD domain-containing putative transcriptional regulator [Nocardioides sp. SR21]|uniref:BTAD domain-containing putative transcriptional regulator n=1 Tax=Nocardioides sp. SR21 TaxID=2919501 RepID=UPI001FAAC068|nr:BTAD domain-containing putative transcriptional regulator [Nocardioides sp. SR21]